MDDEDCFEIKHGGLTAEVTFHRSDGREYWKLTWPDHTIDELHLDTSSPDLPWVSDTIDDPDKVKELGNLINEHG